MKLVKNLPIITLLVFVTTAVNAHAATFDGFYVGTQAGYDFLNATNSYNTARIQVPGVNNFRKIDTAGLNGGFYAGYGKQFDRWYLGLETDFSLGNNIFYNSHPYSEVNSSIKLKYGQTYSFSTRIGYALADKILLYTRLGLAKTTMGYNFIPIGAEQEIGTSSTVGLRSGVGGEMALSDHILARMDWSYTAYRDHRFNGNEKLSPNTNTFRAGVAYKF